MFENFFKKNKKNIRDAGALTAAAGLMATGGTQAIDKPPIPDNINTPPTSELKQPQKSQTLEERAKTAGLGKLILTSTKEQSPIVNSADYDKNGFPVKHIKQTPDPVPDTTIQKTMAEPENDSLQKQTLPNQPSHPAKTPPNSSLKKGTPYELSPGDGTINWKNINSPTKKSNPTDDTLDNTIKPNQRTIQINPETDKEASHVTETPDSQIKTIPINPNTGKKYQIPSGYKAVKESNGEISFVLKTGSDYEKENKKVLHLKKNDNGIIERDNDVTQTTDKNIQPSSDIIITSDNEPSLNVGGKINWGHLGMGLETKNNKTSRKQTSSPKQSTGNKQPKNKKFNEEKRPSIPKGVTMGYTANDTPTTLDLTEHLADKSGVSSYDNNTRFSTPESMLSQKNEDANKEKESLPASKKQSTPDNSVPTKEGQPLEPANPPKQPERDITGPTAIAFNESESKNIPPKLNNAVKTIEKYLPRLNKKQTTAILASMLTGLIATQETQANTINQERTNNPTEHTLSDTKEAHNQTVHDAYFKWLKEYEKHMFDEKPLTKEKFVEDYNNTHPNANISIAELDKFGV